MPNDNVTKLIQPGVFDDQLTEILRTGARALLAQAVEAEVTDFLGKHANLKTEDGHQRVVRHGHLPEREVMTGIGPATVRQPPAILPPYMRGGSWHSRYDVRAKIASGHRWLSYRTKYDKAAECLAKDRDALLTFYDFPAEHWKHLRTTYPIESTFATVHHRMIRSKLLIEPHRTRHGLQARRGRAEKLAAPRRPQPVPKIDSRSEVHQWPSDGNSGSRRQHDGSWEGWEDQQGDPCSNSDDN